MISILAIAMIFISFVGNAQPDTLKLASIKEKSMAISNRMERDLSLSATQTQQIMQLAQERFDNLKLENPDDLSRFEKVNQKALAKLSTILTKDQYDIYMALRAETKKQKEESLKANPNFKFSNQDIELDF